jgi:hypothetical protein
MHHRTWLCALLTGVIGGAAGAVSLPQDGLLHNLPGTSAAIQPKLAGQVVADESVPFSYDIDANGSGASFLTYTLSGTVQSQVVRALDGTYDFYWRVQPNPLVPYRGLDAFGDPTTGVDSLPYLVKIATSSFTLSGFSTPTMQADWLNDGASGVQPLAAAAGNGKVVFGFGDDFVNPVTGELETLPAVGLMPHEESRFFFVDTEAQAYAKTGSFELDSLAIGLFGGSSASYATFAPSAVPEPQTYALMLAGLGGVLMAGRRRRRH